MDQQQYIRFWEFLQVVPDPRGHKGRRYAWRYLLSLICLALLGGQKCVAAIAHWCVLNREKLLELMPDAARIPSVSTFYRVLRQVDISQLEAQVSAYQHTVDAECSAEGAVIGRDGQIYRGQALDGKAIRGAETHGQPMHLLGLARHVSGTMLDQLAIAEKGNEISQSGVLIRDQGDLTGTVTTMDAMLTQRKLAQQICQQGGHYLMEVKNNQPGLLQEITNWFDAPAWPADMEDRESYVYENGGHGREERRVITTSAGLSSYLTWPGARQVARRICERYYQGQLKSREVHYGITSLAAEQVGPQAIEAFWRQHWTIENKVHYVRDETFGEDRGQVHTGSTAQALSALRNALLTALRRAGWTNLAAALRHHQVRLQDSLQLLGLSFS